MNKKKTEYDEIKGMLSTLRNLNESKFNTKPLLREQEMNHNDGPPIQDPQVPQQTNNVPSVDSSKSNYDNVEVINDVEVKLVSTDQEDVKLNDNEKSIISQVIDSFSQQVSQLGELDPGITMAENQIRLDGSILDLDINFVFIVGEEAGFYVNSEMLSITDNTLLMLGKLLKYNLTFTSSMEPLLKIRRTS